MAHLKEPAPPQVHRPARESDALASLSNRLRIAREMVQRGAGRIGIPLLRISLGVIFLWFGALKITNSTPVARLVAETVPFLPATWFVPLLGALEVAIGIGLLLRLWTTTVVTVMLAHLAGTFLVLITQPGVAFQHGNPLMLTMTGEFVIKNLILISAGLVLIAPRTGPIGPAKAID